MNKKAKKTSAAPGKVRILGGHWRSRTLTIGNEDGLRPTGSRIRETLFNWLMPYIHGAHCLDMYAGTGALGLEALSRGAQQVHFFETNRRSAERLQQNLASLNAPSGCFQVVNKDVLNMCSSLASHIDIAFVDPPFQLDLWQPSIDRLASAELLAREALIYVESPRGTKFTVPNDWQEHRTLNAGAINATLYLRTPM